MTDYAREILKAMQKSKNKQAMLIQAAGDPAEQVYIESKDGTNLIPESDDIDVLIRRRGALEELVRHGFARWIQHPDLPTIMLTPRGLDEPSEGLPTGTRIQ